MKKILYIGLDTHHYRADGEITHLPLIHIVPYPCDNIQIQNALKKFSSYTHVIITSKSSIPLLLNCLTKFNISIHDWKKKNTIAVGSVTANHLQKIGIKPSIIAKDETAEGILSELKQLDLAGSYFFWPHSAQSRPIISDYFMKEGIQFEECAIYDTHTLMPENRPNLEYFDEIVFTSPSTVRAFIQIFGSLPKDKILTSIGPITEAYLKKIANLHQN